MVTPEPVVPSLDALLAQVTPENVHAETDVGPAVGHEQAGRRPALVLTPAAYQRAGPSPRTARRLRSPLA